MNKLLMNNNINTCENIIITKKSNDLIIAGSKNITIFNEPLDSLIINVQENAKVIINDFRIINKANTIINFKVAQNASLIYHHAFINHQNYTLKIDASYLGTNSEIILKIHGINDGGKTNLQIDGLINKTNFDNVLEQNVKMINISGGMATAIPNMLINNAKIIANHNVTIGKVSEDELAYLMSKGISHDPAQKLILTGFITKVITDQNLKIKIKELIA